MAGLYFHIPFCRRICAYCDFFKSAEVGRVDSVLDAMGRELDGAVDWLADRRIRTVYFGGGTPSLCDPARLQGLADRGRRCWIAAVWRSLPSRPIPTI